MRLPFTLFNKVELPVLFRNKEPIDHVLTCFGEIRLLLRTCNDIQRFFNKVELPVLFRNKEPIYHVLICFGEIRLLLRTCNDIQSLIPVSSYIAININEIIVARERHLVENGFNSKNMQF